MRIWNDFSELGDWTFYKKRIVLLSIRVDFLAADRVPRKSIWDFPNEQLSIEALVLTLAMHWNTRPTLGVYALTSFFFTYWEHLSGLRVGWLKVLPDKIRDCSKGAVQTSSKSFICNCLRTKVQQQEMDWRLICRLKVMKRLWTSEHIEILFLYQLLCCISNSCYQMTIFPINIFLRLLIRCKSTNKGVCI